MLFSCLVLASAIAAQTPFTTRVDYPDHTEALLADKNGYLVQSYFDKTLECPPAGKATKLVLRQAKLFNVATGLCYEATKPVPRNTQRILVATPCQSTTTLFTIQNRTLVSLTSRTCLINRGGPYGLTDLPPSARSCASAFPPVRVLTGC